MKIDLSHTLEHDIVTLSQDEPMRDPALPGRGPVHYQLIVTRSGDEVLVRGQLSVLCRFSCSRCLVSFERTVASDIAAEYHLDTTAGSHIIDITPDARELLIISLPDHPLCKTSCKGLCPRCGIDQNTTSCSCARHITDGRLLLLKDIKIKKR
jgi:uncharacterized protein